VKKGEKRKGREHKKEEEEEEKKEVGILEAPLL
jgi:hypothetical protein